MLDSPKNKLDTLFSLFIRMRDQGQCYTCPVKKSYKEMEAGHFVGRANMATRFDETNVHTQCKSCNNFRDKKEMIAAYASRLDKEYGQGTSELLLKKGRTVLRYFDYPYWSSVYKDKIKELRDVNYA